MGGWFIGWLLVGRLLVCLGGSLVPSFIPWGVDGWVLVRWIED